MKLKNNILRLSSITVLLAVTISLSATSAMAMPGLGQGTIPATPVQGQTTNLQLTGSMGSAPHTFVSVRTFEPGLGVSAPGGHAINGIGPLPNTFFSPCTTDPTMPISDGVVKSWDLMHGTAAGTKVVAQFNIAMPFDILSISFGTGAGAETVLYNGGALVAANVADAGTPDVYHWEQIATSPSPGVRDDNTNILTSGGNFYTYIDCGSEAAANPAFFDDHDWATQEPIGGEILAINTAALLIAGLSTSAIWMIPAAGAVAGTAVTLYKLRQK